MAPAQGGCLSGPADAAARTAGRGGVDVATLRRVALALPGVEEGTSYGTLAFRLRKTFLCRLRDDDQVLVLGMESDRRDLLVAAEPAVFFVTDHYRGYPMVLVRLAALDEDRLAALLREAWQAADRGWSRPAARPRARR